MASGYKTVFSLLETCSLDHGFDFRDHKMTTEECAKAIQGLHVVSPPPDSWFKERKTSGKAVFHAFCDYITANVPDLFIDFENGFQIPYVGQVLYDKLVATERTRLLALHREDFLQMGSKHYVEKRLTYLIENMENTWYLLSNIGDDLDNELEEVHGYDDANSELEDYAIFVVPYSGEEEFGALAPAITRERYGAAIVAAKRNADTETFMSWVVSQADSPDYIGELARYYGEIGSVLSYEDAKTQLREYPPTYSLVVATLDRAHREYVDVMSKTKEE